MEHYPLIDGDFSILVEDIQASQIANEVPTGFPLSQRGRCGVQDSLQLSYLLTLSMLPLRSNRAEDQNNGQCWPRIEGLCFQLDQETAQNPYAPYPC